MGTNQTLRAVTRYTSEKAQACRTRYYQPVTRAEVWQDGQPVYITAWYRSERDAVEDAQAWLDMPEPENTPESLHYAEEEAVWMGGGSGDAIDVYF